MESSKKGSASRGNRFDHFGSDVMRRIFSYLPPMSLAYCTVVCSSWHSIINSSQDQWKTAYLHSHRRLKPRRTETLTSTGEKNADFRAAYIDEEQRTRLALGRVSIRHWKAHSGRVNSCKMVMGTIVSGSSDFTVKVWCGRTLKCVEEYRVPEKAPVVEVEFDESKVMGAAGKHVLVWRRMGNRKLLRRMGGYSEISSMSVADSELAVGCQDGTVKLFDLYSGRCTQMFRLHTEPVKAVVMDVEAQTMVSGSSDGTVQLFDAKSGQKIASLLRPPSMTGISCLRLGALDRKLFAGNMGAELYCFDLRNQRTLWKTRVGGGAITCMHSPSYSRSTIGVGAVDGEIKVFEADSAERIASFHAKSSRRSAVLSMAVGMTKLVSCHADWSMIQWQLGEPGSVSSDAEDVYGRTTFGSEDQ